MKSGVGITTGLGGSGGGGGGGVGFVGFAFAVEALLASFFPLRICESTPSFKLTRNIINTIRFILINSFWCPSRDGVQRFGAQVNRNQSLGLSQ